MKRRRRPAVEEALFATAINVTPTESLLLFELRPARSLGLRHPLPRIHVYAERLPNGAPVAGCRFCNRAFSWG